MNGFNPDRAERLLIVKGLRRSFLAGECAITTNYLSLLLNGHKSPSEKVISRMAETLGTTSDYLTNRSNEPNPKVRAAG
jgi:transcriptional regulator with XRE-family HTH domain